ncbi:hypothetical protein BDZ94DRAFT_1278220 [Collybia nuda]|uniref:Uncharacterized protein n=1 Tax=Collybia nuda TaxID=64659 RepID=A0A9P5XTG7_9AGAR|nr:hypothetical protein BDZ94DRAFT_1278220 [Collybia nuda]
MQAFVILSYPFSFLCSLLLCYLTYYPLYLFSVVIFAYAGLSSASHCEVRAKELGRPNIIFVRKLKFPSHTSLLSTS